MDLKILALVFNFVLICWPKTNLITVKLVAYICQSNIVTMISNSKYMYMIQDHCLSYIDNILGAQ